MFERERQEWETRHPGQDFDAYINNRVDEIREQQHEES